MPYLKCPQDSHVERSGSGETEGMQISALPQVLDVGLGHKALLAVHANVERVGSLGLQFHITKGLCRREPQ